MCAAGEGDVRLGLSVVAADGSAEYGRLEMFYKGGWGTICGNEFTNRFSRRIAAFSAGAVNVACRQLGYQEGVQIQDLVRVMRCSAEVPLPSLPVQAHHNLDHGIF